MRPILTALLLAFATPAAAQPIGITGAEFRLGAVASVTADPATALGPVPADGSPGLTLGFAAVNVAITQHHGLQLDGLLEGSPAGAIGRLGAHLFMTPVPAQKYGLWATLSDLDGKPATWGGIGIEGILALSPARSLELRGGIGYGTDGLDWITAGATFALQSGRATLQAGLILTEFDEPGLQSIASELSLGAEVSLTDRLGTYADLTHARLDGTPAAPETLVRAGLTLTLGAIGGTATATRLFRANDPAAQLVRRGWY